MVRTTTRWPLRFYHKLLRGNGLFADMGKCSPKSRYNNTTFTEFWQAHEAGTLIHLMDSKGYKQERLDFPFLGKFLSVPAGGLQPSVWSLKQFIAINSPADHEPNSAMDIDYGLLDCRTLEDTCILMEIYKRLLVKAGPLDRHQACLEGRLFESAHRFLNMDEKYRILMKNFRPLDVYQEIIHVQLAGTGVWLVEPNLSHY